MQRSVFPWLALVVAVGLFAVVASAEARGRQSSPFIKTPYGMIPKSVYNQGFVNNPAKLQQYRQREQQMLKKMQGTDKSGTNSTGKKPTTTKKK